MSCDSNSSTVHYPRYEHTNTGMSGRDLATRSERERDLAGDESENNDKAMSGSWPRGTQ